MTLDLIRKVAHLAGEDPEPEPDAWYRAKLRKEPDYSGLQRLLQEPIEIGGHDNAHVSALDELCDGAMGRRRSLQLLLLLFFVRFEVGSKKLSPLQGALRERIPPTHACWEVSGGSSR